MALRTSGPRAPRAETGCSTRTRHATRLATAALVIASTALLASCTEHRPGPAPTEPVPIPTFSSGASGRELPISAYMLTSRQSAQLDWVRLAATGACMKRYGQQFPVPARPANWDTAGSTYDMMPRRYGVADPEQAHKFGYHLPYESDSASAAPSPQAINQLPEDARVVLLGLDPKTGERVTELHGKQLPEQGCLGEFDRLLPGADGGPMGPGSGGEGIVTQIKAKSWSDAKADQRVVAAAAAWSTCMARHGYSFTDPMEAPANLPSMSESTASPDEIHQADADVACKAEANITGIWFATETDLQNKAINANAEALQKVKATLEAESAELQKLVSRDWTTTA